MPVSLRISGLMPACHANLFPHFPVADCRHHRKDLDEAIHRVLDSGQFVLGQEVQEFETEFAHYLNAGATVGVASGTDAIELMLRALDIGPGDKVVVPALTADASAAGVRRAGAEVLLADIDAATFTLSPQSLAALLSSPAGAGVKAVLVVHLYGQVADWTALQEVAAAHGVILLEDAAQAHGSLWCGRMAGTLGHAAAFSFYSTKNLGALGDAGAVVTNDESLAERARRLRQYGWRERYVSEETGINSRLDELQAAVLRVKLRTLTEQTSRRRELAATYTERLLNAGVVKPPITRPECEPAWHQYVVRSAEREVLRTHLVAAGIPAAVHYPRALHQQPAYAHCQTMPLPVAEQAARKILSLPLHPYLSDEAAGVLCQTVNSFPSRTNDATS
ncbi:MAG: DegT/DnrJ/EryC1/StrS family aminotransferase [Prosthecobacter sp.]